MNFLTHLYLSADEPEAMLGNLVADFIKGPELDKLSPGVMAGVRQHRSVDAFTDRHPVVQRSIGRISKDWGWFSGIIIDVYYDHILAVDWHDYTDTPLRTFADRTYNLIRDSAGAIPESERAYVLRFVEADRLMSYAIPDGSGVERALNRLSARIAARIPKRARQLDEAMPALRAAHRDVAADFHEFFPAAIEHAASWK